MMQTTLLPFATVILTKPYQNSRPCDLEHALKRTKSLLWHTARQCCLNLQPGFDKNTLGLNSPLAKLTLCISSYFRYLHAIIWEENCHICEYHTLVRYIPFDWLLIIRNFRVVNNAHTNFSFTLKVQRCTFLPAPTFAFFVPRTFFCRFFLSLRCLRDTRATFTIPCYK